MTTTTLLRTLVTAFCVTFVVGTVPDMGPCKVIEDLENDFDFDKYATTNGGHWKYQLVPNLKFFYPIKYAGVIYKPTGVKGVYDVTIYNILKSGKTEIFSDGRITYLGNGLAMNNATESGEGNILFKYSFMKYKEDQYMFYYVCTDDGGDTTTDYRNLLVSREQPEEELKRILNDDHLRKFNNDLIVLSVQDSDVDIN